MCIVAMYASLATSSMTIVVNSGVKIVYVNPKHG